MASRYIQKYPIPDQFPLILKNFSRQILRDQPTNIIEYAAQYFQALEAGKPFSYSSAFNVPQAQKQYELFYQPQKAEEMECNDLRINELTGAISRKEIDRLNRIVENVFLKYDRNKNGTLENSQMRQMIKEIYKEGYIDAMPSQGQVREFSKLIDANHNAKVSRRELTVFLRKLIH